MVKHAKTIQTIVLSVFDHFVGLALKGSKPLKPSEIIAKLTQ